MTIVVGHGPDTTSASGLHLAGRLALTTGEDVVVASVLHDPFEGTGLPDFAGVDAEWRAERTRMTDETTAKALAELPDGVAVTQVQRSGRSVPEQLQDEAAARAARLLVVGPSTDGAYGHVALGSTSDRLVHSGSLPVAVAPRGYGPSSDPVARLVVAVNASEKELAFARPVAALAAWLGCPVQLVAFSVRGGRDALRAYMSQDVYDYWCSQVEDVHARMLEAITAAEPSVVTTGSTITQGDGWGSAVEAFPWESSDLLVTGSSQYGPIASVFLGSTAARILRHSPVPIVLVPRA